LNEEKALGTRLMRVLHNQENERLGAIPGEAWGENKE